MEALYVENLLDLTKTIAVELLGSVRYPWEALGAIKATVLQLGEALDPAVFERREGNIWIAKNVKIYPTATIEGPAIIDEFAEVRPGAFIRGAVIVGKGAVVGNSSELKNCILFDGVQVPHYNYVGDSILGYKAHMGAGAVTSNLKSDKTNVVVHARDGEIPTGLRKFGAILGDHVEVGCNSVLNPGTVIGRNANVYPTSCVRGVVPENSIRKNTGSIVAKTKREDA